MVSVFAREGSRSGHVTVRNSCVAWFTAIYRTTAHHGAQVTHRSAFPGLVDLKESESGIQVWQRYYLFIPLRKGLPLPGGRVDLFSREFLSWENFQTALDMNSAWRLGNCSYRWAKAIMIFHLRSGCQVQPPVIVASQEEEIRSAGLVEALLRQTHPVERLWRDSHI